MANPQRKGLRERIARRLFGDLIDAAVASAVTVRVDDSSGWDQVAGGAGPMDRTWSEWRDDADDALEAWRKNFLVRRIVNLTSSYVVGNGITISSSIPEVDAFAQAFWNHRQNRMVRRLSPMCDELTRVGEVFPVLFANRVDGMSYVRFIPASRIIGVETGEGDYELELSYRQLADNVEGKEWIGLGHAKAFARSRGGKGGWHMQPLMLHFAVNRPVGGVRGEGDLVPILPWAKRYSEWLKDRVRLNRVRTRNGVLDVQIADDSEVESKRQQLRKTNPVEAGIYVHGPGEKLVMHDLQVGADDAKEDGRALRLAIATGANVGLHFLGEGESVNYATAKEMGEPTARFYSVRQGELCAFLCDLVEAAWWRRQVALGVVKERGDDDLGLVPHTTEVARADNESLAKAAVDAVGALAEMRAHGWITDEIAIRLAFQFAGEVLSEEGIRLILAEGGSGQGSGAGDGGDEDE